MKEKFTIKNVLIIIAFTILFTWMVFNMSEVKNIVDYIISLLSPFIIGFFIALILNIPMRFFEKRMKEAKKAKRVLALFASILIVLIIITLLMSIIIPAIRDIVSVLYENIPYYKEKLADFVDWLNKTLPNVNFNKLEDTIDSNMDTIQVNMTNNILSLLGTTIQIAKNTFHTILKIFLSIVIACYILVYKENLKNHMKKFAYAYFKKDRADKMIYIGKLFITKFNSFITPAYSEAILIGIICVIGCLILRIPYATTIGILVGITALIPIVGLYIGMFIGALLIVAISPIKAIVFILFMIVLQQIDSNLIYPKLVGDAVGLPELGVLFSVVVLGAFMGVVGMLIAVPVGAIIYTLINDKVEKVKLEDIE